MIGHDGRAAAAANRMPVRYREVAVTTVDFALTEDGLRQALRGARGLSANRIHRRPRPGRDEVALLEVETASREPLFSPITRVELLAGPDEAVFVHAADVDLGVPSQVCRAALRRRPRRSVRDRPRAGTSTSASSWIPHPIRVRLAEVAPPYPAKLLDQAQRVLEVAEDLPPIVLEPEIFDLVELAAARPAERYLFPCRGSGIAPEGTEVYYLDERPPRHDWVLVGL